MWKRIINTIRRIIVPAHLMKESFFEIDRKNRKNIHIYLWTTSLLFPTFVFEEWFEKPFDIDKIPFIGFIIIFYYYLIEIIFLLTFLLKREKSEDFLAEYIFIFKLQLFWIMLIFLGVVSCFGLIANRSSINWALTSFILIAIITLWALKDILYLRQHAFKKIN